MEGTQKDVIQALLHILLEQELISRAVYDEAVDLLSVRKLPELLQYPVCSTEEGYTFEYITDPQRAAQREEHL